VTPVGRVVTTTAFPSVVFNWVRRQRWVVPPRWDFTMSLRSWILCLIRAIGSILPEFFNYANALRSSWLSDPMLVAWLNLVAARSSRICRHELARARSCTPEAFVHSISEAKASAQQPSNSHPTWSSAADVRPIRHCEGFRQPQRSRPAYNGQRLWQSIELIQNYGTKSIFDKEDSSDSRYALKMCNVFLVFCRIGMHWLCWELMLFILVDPYTFVEKFKEDEWQCPEPRPPPAYLPPRKRGCSCLVFFVHSISFSESFPLNISIPTPRDHRDVKPFDAVVGNHFYSLLIYLFGKAQCESGRLQT
jgi:hypothetical protein